MRRRDLIPGLKIGFLTVLEPISSSKEKGKWKYRIKCYCSLCNSTINPDVNLVVAGYYKSCGCYRRSGEYNKLRKTHGMAHSPAYGIWYGMVNRCYKPKDGLYEHYGALGIKVCSFLKESPCNLITIAGEYSKEKPSIDRFPIHNGNYSCGQCEECKLNGWLLNVRWATHKEQVLNRGDYNTYLTAFGKTITISQWRDLTGIGWQTIHERRLLGWTPERCVATPDKHGNCYKENEKLLFSKEQTRTERLISRRKITNKLKRLTAFGKTLTRSEWAEITGLPWNTLKHREENLGWSPEKVVSTPGRKGIGYQGN